MGRLINRIKKLQNSLVGYLPIKVLDGIIGMLTLKVYVSLFEPELFGQYSIYNITISMLYLVVIGWLGMASFRFSGSMIGDDNKSKTYFTSLITAYLITLFSLIVISIIGVLIFPGMINNGGITVVISILLLLIGYSMNQLFITLLIYTEKRALNIKLVLLASIFKLILTVILYYGLEGSVISILISHGSIDIILGFVAVKALGVHKYFNIKYLDHELLKTLFSYGYPLIGLSLVMFLLNFSDQYVIKIVDGDAANGIYKANYSVASSVFMMIMIGMNRSVYPNALKHWNKKEFMQAEGVVSKGFQYFLMIALPSAVGLIMVSDYISAIFLSADYVDGYRVIGVIAASMVFYGMSEYFNKGYELEGNTLPIFIHCLLAAIVNIVLNIVLIPKFGYEVAAYTTLIGFVFYFLLSAFRRAKACRWKMRPSVLVKIILANGIMYLVILVLKYLVSPGWLGLAFIVISAIMVYGVSVLLLGLLNEELKGAVK